MVINLVLMSVFYFVVKGDGMSVFLDMFGDYNKVVDKYI